MRIPPHLFPMSRIPRLAGYVLMAAAVLMAVLARRGLDKIGPVPSVAIILLLGMVGVMLVFTDLMVRGLYARIDAAKACEGEGE